eukprot:scaffold70332_cov59-Phaeocystis_antarctica.AAC.3
MSGYLAEHAAEVSILHELDTDHTYAMGHPSSKSRPSVRGVACLPQWLPVLLATGSSTPTPPPLPLPPPTPPLLSPSPPPTSPSPPPSSPSRPSPPSPSQPGLPGTFTSTASLKKAVQAFDADVASAIAEYGPIADWEVSAR